MERAKAELDELKAKKSEIELASNKVKVFYNLVLSIQVSCAHNQIDFMLFASPSSNLNNSSIN